VRATHRRGASYRPTRRTGTGTGEGFGGTLRIHEGLGHQHLADVEQALELFVRRHTAAIAEQEIAKLIALAEVLHDPFRDHGHVRTQRVAGAEVLDLLRDVVVGTRASRVRPRSRNVRGGEDVGAGVRDLRDTHFIRDQQTVGDEFGGFLVIRQGFVGVHLVLGRPERAEAEFLRVVGVAGNTPEHFARGGAGAMRSMLGTQIRFSL
jgi:hypothetical protein